MSKNDVTLKFGPDFKVSFFDIQYLRNNTRYIANPGQRSLKVIESVTIR